MSAGVIGITLICVSIMVPIVASNAMVSFIFFRALFTILGIGLGLGLMSCGWRDILGGLLGLRYLLLKSNYNEGLTRLIEVYKRLIVYTYAGAMISVILGLIMMLPHYTDMSRFRSGLAVLLLTPFYAVLISECLWRPAAHRIASLTRHDMTP